MINTAQIQPTFQQFGVQYAALFGSRAKNLATDSSDYDFLIEFDKNKKHTLLDIVELKDSLEKILHAPVDLVTRKALHPYLHKSVLSNMQVIYDARA